MIIAQNDNNKKEKQWACSLSPNFKTRLLCKNFKMGLKLNDIHGHLLINSPTQVKQCMWLL